MRKCSWKAQSETFHYSKVEHQVGRKYGKVLLKVQLCAVLIGNFNLSKACALEILSRRCELVNTVTVMYSSQVRALAPTFSGLGPSTCTQCLP